MLWARHGDTPRLQAGDKKCSTQPSRAAQSVRPKRRRGARSKLQVSQILQNGVSSDWASLGQPGAWSNEQPTPDWGSGFQPPQQLYHRSKSVPLIPNRLRVFAGTSNSVIITDPRSRQMSSSYCSVAEGQKISGNKVANMAFWSARSQTFLCRPWQRRSLAIWAWI